MPERIQLRRRKGWRKPPGAVVVARPTLWGNPWRVAPYGEDIWVTHQLGSGQTDRVVPVGSVTEGRRIAVDLYERALHAGELLFDATAVRGELAGHDLACWCPLYEPCHADVLLRVATEAP